MPRQVPNRCSTRGVRAAGNLGQTMQHDSITVRGAREHNLKNVDIVLPRDRLIVFTGLSGSGKSSLAFDTIYAEGQRRYVESLSAYARQFLGQMDKPDVDFIEGLSPAISIDQKSASRNPRSTVGTITEIYDYLRLLYARIGVPHCPNCGRRITRQTPQQIVDRVLQLPEGTRFQVLAPVVRGRKGEYQRLVDELAGQGYTRARVDGELLDLPAKLKLERYEQHTIEVVVDRLVRRSGIERRLTDSLETALKLAEGVAEVEIVAKRGRGGVGDAHVLGAPRVYALRAVVRRARAAELLVQLALRRVRHVRRARHEVPGRPRAGDRRRRPHDRRRCDRAVVRVPGRVLQARPSSRRRRVRLLGRHAVEEAEGRAEEGRALRRGRQERHGQVQESLRASAVVHHEVRRRRALGRAPAHGVGVRSGARGHRGLHAARAVPGVRWGAAEAVVARGHRRAARTSSRSARCRSPTAPRTSARSSCRNATA